MHHVSGYVAWWSWKFELVFILWWFFIIISEIGCGHCKTTKPLFEKAAEHYKDDPRYELAAIDCTKNSALCQRYKVSGYPSFKYFSYLKTVRDYNGGRSVDDFVKYLANPEDEEAVKVKREEDWGEYPGAEKVLQLRDSDFEQRMKTEPKVLVMFHAPCK